MNTVLSSKGQVVLPADIRRRDHLHAGQSFEIERIKCGQYRLELIEPEPNEGLVDWLISCPDKEYFTPVESESTDTLCAIS